MGCVFSVSFNDGKLQVWTLILDKRTNLTCLVRSRWWWCCPPRGLAFQVGSTALVLWLGRECGCVNVAYDQKLPETAGDINAFRLNWAKGSNSAFCWSIPPPCHLEVNDLASQGRVTSITPSSQNCFRWRLYCRCFNRSDPIVSYQVSLDYRGGVTNFKNKYTLCLFLSLSLFWEQKPRRCYTKSQKL